jgi:hypothetical protein
MIGKSMPTTPDHNDANLILRLYELRREERMRKARAWYLSSFTFKTVEEFFQAFPMGTEENASARMVLTYWDMVASFLNSGVLDRELFYKSGNELLFAYLRFAHLMEGTRAIYGDPTAYSELEQAGEAMIEWKKSRSPEGFEAFRKRVRGE